MWKNTDKGGRCQGRLTNVSGLKPQLLSMATVRCNLWETGIHSWWPILFCLLVANGFLGEPSVPVAGNLRDRRSGLENHKEGPKSEHREDNDNELTLQCCKCVPLTVDR